MHTYRPSPFVTPSQHATVPLLLFAVAIAVSLNVPQFQV